MVTKISIRCVLVVIFHLITGGCEQLPVLVDESTENVHADTTGKGSAPVVRYTLADLPFPDHWTWLTLTGSEAGFTHLEVIPGEVHGEFLLRSEAYLQLFLLGTKTTIVTTTTDWVGANLRLRRFHYEYRVDGKKTTLKGRVEDRLLSVEITHAGGTTEQRQSLEQPLYPSRAFFLYPVLNGLGVGRTYSYLIYDGEIAKVKKVVQRVEAYESYDRSGGKAYKVLNNVAGSASQIWIDERGRARLEVSMKGVFLSHLVESGEARTTLLEAAFNQRPFYADYVNIPVDLPLEASSALRVDVDGLGTLVMPSGNGQKCWREVHHQSCQITVASAGAARQALEDIDATTLFESASVNSNEPRVLALADEIAAASDGDGLVLVEALTRWIATRVRRGTDQAKSAHDILNPNAKSGPLGRTYLYGSLARALGIPTRIVNGLVYSPEDAGFIYHSWAESWVSGVWHRVDPAFGGLEADATHIELLKGDTLDELWRLSEVIGRLRVSVLAYD